MQDNDVHDNSTSWLVSCYLAKILLNYMKGVVKSAIWSYDLWYMFKKLWLATTYVWVICINKRYPERYIRSVPNHTSVWLFIRAIMRTIEGEKETYLGQLFSFLIKISYACMNTSSLFINVYSYHCFVL